MKLNAKKIRKSSSQKAPETAVGKGKLCNSSRTGILNDQLQSTFRKTSLRRAVKETFFQADLKISQPGDPLEVEAERMADCIMKKGSEPVCQRGTDSIHRISTVRPGIRRESKNNAGEHYTSTPVTNRIVSSRGAGKPLPEVTRTSMENSFASDFSSVRVHTGREAEELNRDLNARAFTVGNDIYFGKGEYNVNTRKGKHLLAHELTHVIQQGGCTEKGKENLSEKKTTGVNKKELSRKEAPPGEGSAAPGPVELMGISQLNLSPGIIEWFGDKNQGLVNCRFGSMARGTLLVEKRDDLFFIKGGAIPFTHNLFKNTGDFTPGLFVQSNPTTGELTGFIGPYTAGNRAADIFQYKNQLKNILSMDPAVLGLTGIRIPGKLPDFTNKLEGGKLSVRLDGIHILLGNAFNGIFSLGLSDETITFSGNVDVSVKNLARGQFELERGEDGAITGRGNIAVDLPKNFSGEVEVVWDGRKITGMGKVGYAGEKLSGEIILHVMEKSKADSLEQASRSPGQSGEVPETSGDGNEFVLFGEGNLDFTFTEWLSGSAHVIVDQNGYITIIGKITPQTEIELFPQKDFVQPLFKLEVRASYGIPVLGNVFLFANIGMDAFAKIGPAKFYKMEVSGTYSTDPEKCKDFSIKGSLNLSAAAGLRLRGEGGAGLELLGHALKAGVGLQCVAALKAYAEATPVIGYREKQGQRGEDKKGEFFIKGDLEIAARPALELGGDLFIEVDSPWWSPLGDRKWTWPLFNREYPLGGNLGLLASIDYVFGSGQWPSVSFKPVEFDGEKFLTDIMNDKTEPAKNEQAEQPADWQEKNSNDAAPPSGRSSGDARPGQMKETSPPAPTEQRGTVRRPEKEVDPNARTADGRTVADYQAEAERGRSREPVPGRENDEKAEDSTGDLWKGKEEFTARDGSRHELYYKDEGPRAQLVVASFNPQAVGTRIKEKEAEAGRITEPARREAFVLAVKQAKNQITRIMAIERYIKQRRSEKKTDKDRLWTAINKLARYLEVVMTRAGEEAGYENVRYPASDNTGLARENTRVEYLNRSKGFRRGQISSQHNGKLHGWDLLERYRLVHKQGGPYVKMHILSESLGGMAVNSNLTPAPTGKNSDFNRNLEGPALEEINRGQMIWYQVNLEYMNVTDPILNSTYRFPRTVNASYGFYEYENGRWKAQPIQDRSRHRWSSGTIAPPKLEFLDVYINRITTEDSLHEKLRISKKLARNLIEYRAENGAWDKGPDRIRLFLNAVNLLQPLSTDETNIRLIIGMDKLKFD